MPKAGIGTTLKSLFGKWSFFYLLLIYPLPTIVSWMVGGWLPTYYQEQFHLSQATAGEYATAYLYPASIVGLLLGGFLTDKWQKTYPYARIVVPIIGFAVAAPCIFMIGYIHILWQVVALFLIYGFARMFIDANLMPILCMVIDGRHRATGFGIINMLTVFTGGMSMYVTGALRDAHISLGTVFQYASLGLMLCVLLLFLVKREVKKNIKKN
jgi:sugar phosphate permease